MKRYKFFSYLATTVSVVAFFVVVYNNAFVKKCNWNDWGETRCLGSDWPATPESVSKIDVHARDGYGNTPLHLAVRGSSPETIDALLQAGADVNAVNDSGNTPLHESGREPIVRKLIESGADVAARDEDGNSPLHLAMLRDSLRGRENDIWIVRTLLEAGADVNAVNLGGDTPLHLAVSTSSFPLIGENLRITSGFLMLTLEMGNARAKQALYHGDADDPFSFLTMDFAEQALDRLDNTNPLSVAMDIFNIEVVNILIRAGANVNARDVIGRTPLHKIASFPRADNKFLDNVYEKKIYEALSVLLQAGADINARDGDGATPLHRSLGPSPFDGRDSTAVFLIQQGADVHVRDIHGELPLDYAKLYSHTNALSELQKAGAQ